jgi:hypothetical protein
MSKTRTPWLDVEGETPLIDDYARELSGFLDALADGVVSEKELKAQEERYVALLKEVEPKLDDATHEKVTRLLCETSAYSVMQVLYELQRTRARTVFRG